MGRIPHRLIEGCLIARARDPVQAASSSTSAASTSTEYEVLQRARRRGARGRALRRRRRSSCTAAPARTSAARRRRCSTRSRASAASRGRGRRSRRSRASTCRRRRSTTSQTIATVPAIIAMGADGVREDRRRDLAGHGDLLALRQRREPGQLRARARLDAARADLRRRRRRRRTAAQLKAIIPGGSSVPILTPDQLDTPMDYDSIARRRLVLRLGGGDRDRRPLLHGAARAARGEVLHARVVRQVHAVPRGDALARADPARRSRTAAASTRDLDLLESVGDRILGQSLCALGDFAVYPVQSYLRKFRDEFEAHVEQGGCPFGGESSIEGIVAPADQHAHHPVATVPS